MMQCTGDLSRFMTDCITKPDWINTVKLVKACGFPLLDDELTLIETGFAEAVTIGFTKRDDTPYVEITIRGYSSYFKLHDGGPEAASTVRNIIKTFFDK